MISDFRGEHAFLSNFHPSEITVYGIKFATVEHAFQSYKITTMENAMRVRACQTPGIAKRLARSLPKRPDWEHIKDDVMFGCCLLKFEDPILRKLLLETGDHELIEGNTWGDHYWGVCNGIGLNKLGEILMQIRKAARA